MFYNFQNNNNLFTINVPILTHTSDLNVEMLSTCQRTLIPGQSNSHGQLRDTDR
jgi:hypothetical protein